MCCFLTILVFLGPRFTIIAWYFARTTQFNAAIDSVILSCLGFLFLPWTMLSYLVSYSILDGGVTGFGWVIVFFGFLLDIMSYSGGGYGNRDRIQRYR